MAEKCVQILCCSNAHSFARFVTDNKQDVMAAESLSQACCCLQQRDHANSTSDLVEGKEQSMHFDWFRSHGFELLDICSWPHTDCIDLSPVFQLTGRCFNSIATTLIFRVCEQQHDGMAAMVSS